MVGTSGSPTYLFSEVTARGLSAPPLINAITGARISNAACTSLLLSAVITDGVALNGTTCASIPDIDLNNSAARFCVLPGLIVPMLSVLGFAFEYAIRSLTEAILEAESTTTTRSKKPTVDTGAKSFSVSYGRDLNSDTLTALPLVRNSSV